MYCSKCKKEIKDGSRYCKYCGTPQIANNESSESSDNEKRIATSNRIFSARLIKIIAVIIILTAVFLIVFFAQKRHEEQSTPAKKWLTDDFLLPIREGESYGYKNLSGKWVIEPQFEYANLFLNNDTAIVVEDKQGFFIDRQGQITNTIKIDAPVEKIEEVSKFFKDDFVNGKMAIRWRTNYSSENYGFMDEEGNVNELPDNLEFCTDRDGGSTEQMLENGWYLVSDSSLGTKGYLDVNMNWVIPADYESLGVMGENGLIAAQLEGKWGFINEKGEWVISPNYDNVGKFGTNGLAPVRLKNEYGYIDENGDIVIDLGRYDYVENFGVSNLAEVVKNDKIGFINSSGKEVIPFEYDRTEDTYSQNHFTCNLVGVAKEGKWGCVDGNNNVLIPLEYDRCYPISDKVIVAINHEGETIILNNRNEKIKTGGEIDGRFCELKYGLNLFYNDTEYWWVDSEGNIYE